MKCLSNSTWSNLVPVPTILNVLFMKNLNLAVEDGGRVIVFKIF